MSHTKELSVSYTIIEHLPQTILALTDEEESEGGFTLDCVRSQEFSAGREDADDTAGTAERPEAGGCVNTRRERCWKVSLVTAVGRVPGAQEVELATSSASGNDRNVYYCTTIHGPCK